MKALEEKILKEGKVLPGNILKVDSFLNHKIDADFMLKMGEEIAKLFNGSEITKILTIETSGIAIALAAAMCMHLPLVFAKKNRSSNIASSVYSTVVHSFTHNTDYTVVVAKEHIEKGDKILIVDDFLANGKALIGLMDIVNQAGAETVACCCAIEKGFQRGGQSLREKGIRVESLAIVESMSDTSLTFRPQD